MEGAQNWKPSVFNILLKNDGRQFAFNGASAHAVELKDGQAGIFNDSLEEIEQFGTCVNADLLKCLTMLGFAVPRDEDEYGREHAAYHRHQLDRDKLRITIVPTMACNLRCSYCFQGKLSRSGLMSPEIQRGTVEFISRQIQGSKALAVQWFGGEPLLAYDCILSMSEALMRSCESAGVQFQTEMVSNATLLTKEMIEGFRRISLKAIQIPMDGKAATYAKRKQISLAKAEAFIQSIVENMQRLVDVTGSVTIRINVDRDNAGEAKEVVRMFTAQGVRDPRIDFRLGFLNASRGIIDCIPHDCLSPSQFVEEEAEVRRFLMAEGFRVFDEPARRNHPCSAPLVHAFTVDPAGRIGKCVPATGSNQSVFAQIYPNDINRTVREVAAAKVPYTEFDPFEIELCKGCQLLPVCLGSCPKMHAPDATTNSCLKEGLAERIAFFYMNPV
jgi:uncharacterized protein